MKKITGFLREACVEISRQPGQSAQEVVRRLLRAGRVQSAARNPEGSLVGTLHKHYQEHGLERRKEGGVYRFYPDNVATNQPGARGNSYHESRDGEVIVTLRLPRRVADVADTLIATGTCRDRAEAVKWLVDRGISAIRV